MKPILALFGGFVVATVIFASGAALAVYFLHAEPVRTAGLSGDQGSLWTTTPRKVEGGDNEGLERTTPMVAETEQDDVVSVDYGATTASIGGAVNVVEADVAPVSEEHIQWCRSRYRSYSEADDSYTSYSGESRPCISPYSEDAASTPDAELMTASASTNSNAVYDSIGDQHVRECMNRYRSYRIEDNTYQPYGGGPRRQCR